MFVCVIGIIKIVWRFIWFLLSMLVSNWFLIIIILFGCKCIFCIVCLNVWINGLCVLWINGIFNGLVKFFICCLLLFEMIVIWMFCFFIFKNYFLSCGVVLGWFYLIKVLFKLVIIFLILCFFKFFGWIWYIFFIYLFGKNSFNFFYFFEDFL